MEYYLIDYLIDEGYANTESSAYKILSVISEEFYEYLLSEAETDEQKRARRRREISRTFGRAESARRREENRAIDPYNSRTGAQQDRPSPRGGELPTRGQLARDSAANRILAATPENPNRPHRKVTSNTGAPLISQSDRSALTTTFRDVRSGQKPSQVFQPNISSSINVGSGSASTRLSRDESDEFSRGTTSSKKKPQTSQPQAQRTTPSGRVRKLPRQEPTRATSARRKPQPQSPTQTSSTPQRKPTPQELERQNRPKPTNLSAGVAKPVTTTRLATGITRRRPQITGIQPQNPNK